MRRKIAIFLFGLVIACGNSWAATCEVISIGTGQSTSGATVDMTGKMPTGYRRGDLLLFFAGAFGSGATSTVDPTGWTLITTFNNGSVEVWGYLADSTSIAAPSITFGAFSGASGFVTAIRNPDGFPALGSILGNVSTGTYSSAVGFIYRALSVTQGGECAFQASLKLLTDVTTNPISAVTVTSGYISVGSAWLNFNNRPLIAAQLFDGDATAPDLPQNIESLTGNTTEGNGRQASFTLLDGDITPTAFTFTDVTDASLSTQYISDEKTIAGITNFAEISISGSNCEYSVEGGSYTNTVGTIGVGEGVMVRTTSSGSANTAVNCTLTVGTEDDTWSVTTAAGATDFSPHLVSDSFTDSDATAIASHSPDVNEPGNSWTGGKIYTPASDSSVEIQGDELEIAVNNGATIDIENNDYYIETQWTTPVSGVSTMNGILLMRWQDSDNMFECRFTGTQVLLRSVVSNVYTTIGSANFVLLNNTQYRIGAFSVGNQLGCRVDGNITATAINSTGNTRTKVGIGSRNSDGLTLSFDNFYAMRGFSNLLTDTQLPADDPQGFFYQSVVQDGSSFWANPNNLPDQTYNSWNLYPGGSWYYDPETDFVGSDVWGIESFNSATNQIETASVTYTTVSDSPATSPSWGTIPDQQLEVGVSFSLDLCQYLTTAGIPPATLTLQSGSFATGLDLLPDGCTLAGVPSTASGSPFTATVRATNASGTDDDTFTMTVTAQTGELPICQPLPVQYLQIGVAATINLAAQCRNTTTINMGTLANGLVNNAGIVSGIPQAKQQISTKVDASNSAGSYSFNLIQVVRDRASSISNPIRN